MIAEPDAEPAGLAPMPEPSGAGIYGLTSGELSDTTSGVLVGVSAVPFATAATGYCPLYQLFGIDRSF